MLLVSGIIVVICHLFWTPIQPTSVRVTHLLQHVNNPSTRVAKWKAALTTCARRCNNCDSAFWFGMASWEDALILTWEYLWHLGSRWLPLLSRLALESWTLVEIHRKSHCQTFLLIKTIYPGITILPVLTGRSHGFSKQDTTGKRKFKAVSCGPKVQSQCHLFKNSAT